jgi:hypothetical protein
LSKGLFVFQYFRVVALAMPLTRAEVVEAFGGGFIMDDGRPFFGEPFPDADVWLKMRVSSNAV